MGATVIAVGMVTRDDVEAAAARTRHVVRHTPLTLVEPGVFAGTVMLKLEQLQHTGSYAVRGVFNHVICALERQAFDPDAGLAAAFTPSIAAGVVHAARRLGLPATLFLPVGAPVDADVLDAASGALPDGSPPAEILLVRVDGTVADARIEAQRHAATTGALQCAGLGPDGWPEMVAGAGTVGLELWTQTLGQLDTVIVPGRARALTAGIGAALAGHVRVVEADGGRVDAAAARRELWRSRRIAVDEVAACAYAFVADGAYRPAPEERVAIVLASADADGPDADGAESAAGAVTDTQRVPLIARPLSSVMSA